MRLPLMDEPLTSSVVGAHSPSMRRALSCLAVLDIVCCIGVWLGASSGSDMHALLRRQIVNYTFDTSFWDIVVRRAGVRRLCEEGRAR